MVISHTSLVKYNKIFSRLVRLKIVKNNVWKFRYNIDSCLQASETHRKWHVKLFCLKFFWPSASSTPDSIPIPLQQRWWTSITSIWSSLYCSKLCTRQSKCPCFKYRQKSVPKGQMDMWNLTGKLCYYRIYKYFIIPVSQKVC